MKRCPKCSRRYDDTLSFCLEDGTPLGLERDSDPTIASPRMNQPRAQWTARPTVERVARPSYRFALIGVVIILAMILGGAAVALLYHLNKWPIANNENGSTPGVTPDRKSSSTVVPTSSPKAEPTVGVNISGDWTIVNTVESTSYPAYANLRLAYHVIINQTGSTFTGDGEKRSESGRELDPAERTPIHIVGSVNENVLRATFTEEGQRRTTSGTFIWTITQGGNRLNGTFASTAAKSSGPSVATRN